jgi:hypothetical protein
VFDIMPQWQIYWLLVSLGYGNDVNYTLIIDYFVSLGYENYIEWCLGYDGNDGHKLYWNDDYIEWF